MQIVYISARPTVLAGTLRQVQRFMPFVDEVVVAAPATLAQDVRSPAGMKLTVVTDEELLGAGAHGLQDHQERNFMLRAQLVDSAVTEEAFFMSDDDSRPRGPITKEVFLEEGKSYAYYFYDLARWPGHKTDFDKGQHNTAQVLRRYGYPQLSYASHMPQLVYKDCYRACLGRFVDEWRCTPLCEWSLYFNYAISEFAGRFHSPQPYLTFCWPDAPYTWPLYVEPQALLFENFYPRFYGLRGIFAGLEDTPLPGAVAGSNAAKEARWRQLGVARLNGRLPLHDPWVRGSRLRWFAARVAAPWFRRRYRANLARAAGSVTGNSG
jgi:hypothetical protein